MLFRSNVAVGNYNLVAYKMQQCTGEIEYTINLTAGTSSNRNTISLQSHWFTDSYQSDENLYNLQLWATSYATVQSMAAEVISNLQAKGVLLQTTLNNDLPSTYITRGSRNRGIVSLDVMNTKSTSSAYLEIKEKAVEGGVETVRTEPISNLPLNQTTSLNLDLKDSYEATINLYVNNKKVDNVYINDGTWSTDYDKSTTSINSFTVQNEGVVNNSTEEYRLMRNVSFSATTKDYVTAYKTVGTKCKSLSLSSYKSLKFTANATGASSVTITLISSNITNWNEQYTYTVNLSGNQEYAVSLSKFISSKYNTPVNANSITAVSFAFNNGKKGVNTNMSVSLSKARFSTSVVTSVEQESSLSVSPNPNNGKFTATFNSITTEPVQLQVIELSTGRVVSSVNYNAQKGSNVVSINLQNNAKYVSSGMYILNITSDNQSFKPAKLVITNR